MLSAYGTRSVRQSRSRSGKWFLSLTALLIAGGIALHASGVHDIRAMASLLPDVTEISEQAMTRQPPPVKRTTSFRISGPAAAGIALLVNDSPQLRARAEQIRQKHAVRRQADESTGPAGAASGPVSLPATLISYY